MAHRWDPEQYLHYAGERERPFWDLVGRVPLSAPRRVVDLGCGPGTATVGLVDRWPDAEILGLDNSPAMIERAAALAIPGRLRFDLADAATWTPEAGTVDLIVSNALLQWVPDHLRRLAPWLEALAPGGVFAFQVPGNFGAPSHTLLRELAESPEWRDRTAAVTARHGTPEPVEYHRHLRDLGALVANLDVWETTYLHALTGPDPVLDWVRGTALGPYLSVLSEADAAEFTSAYGELLRAAYPVEADGVTVWPFRRLFVVAQRS